MFGRKKKKKEKPKEAAAAGDAPAGGDPAAGGAAAEEEYKVGTMPAGDYIVHVHVDCGRSTQAVSVGGCRCERMVSERQHCGYCRHARGIR